MATIFTRIINGELPGQFVYTDDLVVAFLSIMPLTPGHTLVVSRQEVDQWTDADEPLMHHCMDVARRARGWCGRRRPRRPTGGSRARGRWRSGP